MIVCTLRLPSFTSRPHNMHTSANQNAPAAAGKWRCEQWCSPALHATEHVEQSHATLVASGGRAARATRGAPPEGALAARPRRGTPGAAHTAIAHHRSVEWCGEQWCSPALHATEPAEQSNTISVASGGRAARTTRGAPPEGALAAPPRRGTPGAARADRPRPVCATAIVDNGVLRSPDMHAIQRRLARTTFGRSAPWRCD